MGDATVELVEIYSILDANGRKRVIGIFDVTLSDSYTTGGDTVNLSAYFTKVNLMAVETPIAGSYLLEPVRNADPAQCKIKVYTAVGTEATAGTDLSAVKVRIKVEGN